MIVYVVRASSCAGEWIAGIYATEEGAEKCSDYLLAQKLGVCVSKHEVEEKFDAPH